MATRVAIVRVAAPPALHRLVRWRRNNIRTATAIAVVTVAIEL